MRVGKGTQVWKASGDIYDGDWEEGMRHGYGMLSVRDESSGEYVKKYSGGWRNDRRHVRASWLSIAVSAQLIHTDVCIYSGTPLIWTLLGQKKVS